MPTAPHSDGAQSTQGGKVHLAGSTAISQTEFLETVVTTVREGQQSKNQSAAHLFFF